MDKSVIAKVQGLGFDVYMRDTADTWMLFTDGTRIGTLTAERFGGFGLSTVHKPNTTSGTGFRITENGLDDFTRADLEKCFITAPAWADRYSREASVKWKNIAAFLAADSWNGSYKLVPPQA